MTLARRSAVPVTGQPCTSSFQPAAANNTRAGYRWPGISRILAKLGAKGRVEIVREGAAPRRLALAGARQPAPLRQSVVT